MSGDKFAPILEGVKHGAVKKAVDMAVAPFSDPLSKGIMERWDIRNPALSTTVEAGCNFVVMLGIAEAISVLGPMIGKDEVWIKNMAEYIRIYAGERLGSEGLEAAMSFIPDALMGLKELDSESIKGALEAHGTGSETKISSLFDFEEIEEKVGKPTDGENK